MGFLSSDSDGGEVEVTDVGTTDSTVQSYTPDSGGFVTEPEPDIYVPPPEPEPTQPTGGEHTYDVDPSAEADVSLDYSSINDPRQTADSTEGTAGGWAAPFRATGWSGGIASGLDENGSSGLPGSPTETIRAISDATHTVVDGVRTHTTDIARQDGEDMGLPDLPDYDGGPVIPDITLPDITLPDIPTPDFETNITIPGMKWVAVAILAAVAFFGYQESQSGN